MHLLVSTMHITCSHVACRLLVQDVVGMGHLFISLWSYSYDNRIGGVMVSGLEYHRSWVRSPVGSNQTIKGVKPDNKMCICYISAKHAALRRKSKDWLARNQDNVSEWSDMYTRGLLNQWASTITRGSQEPVITHLVFNLTSKVDRKWGCYTKFGKWVTQRSFQLKFLSTRFWCNFYLVIFLNGINWLKKSHRKT